MLGLIDDEIHVRLLVALAVSREKMLASKVFVC